MKKLFINYHTGAGNEYVEDLGNAMEIADNGATYTQQDITIEDEDGNVLARRRWWGVAYDPEATEETEDEVIRFGDYGYYGAWA